MPRFEVLVRRTQVDCVRYRVDAAGREDAIAAAEEQYEGGEGGVSVDLIEGSLEWSTAEVEEV